MGTHGFGISPDRLAISPSEILSNEIQRGRLSLEKRSLDLAERRMALQMMAADRAARPRGRVGGLIMARTAPPKQKEEDPYDRFRRRRQEARDDQRADNIRWREERARQAQAKKLREAGFVPQAPKGWDRPVAGKTLERIRQEADARRAPRAKVISDLSDLELTREFRRTIEATGGDGELYQKIKRLMVQRGLVETRQPPIADEKKQRGRRPDWMERWRGK